MNRLFLLSLFILGVSNYVFSQCGYYFIFHASNQNEYTLKVLQISDDSTYWYKSFFCNKNGLWTRIDSSAGKWSIINKHTMELKTYDYIAANNETKKLLRILNGPDYMTFSYITLTIRNHHLINKKYSVQPFVRWKKLKINNQDRNKIKEYLEDSLGHPMDDNGKSKGEGQTIFSNLRHETTHAYQFEYGEIAFECNQNGYWEPANYDIMDEYEAHTNQNFGFTWGLKQGSSRERWTRSSTSVDEKIKALEATPSYRGLPTGPCNNENTIKIKDNKCYSLPNRKRPTVGKSYGISTTLITDIGYPDFDWFYIDAFYKDTIFSFKISISKNMVVSCDTFIHLNSRWWLKTSNFHNQIVVQRFRKVRPSEEFIKNQGRLFFADYEVRCVEMNVYDQNFMLCQKFIKVGPLAYSSGEIELPKRRMRAQIKKAYEQYLYVDTNDD